MATLFIANVRHQNFSYIFNVKGSGRGMTHRLELEPFAQKLVWKEADEESLLYLLDQIHHYGFKTFEEAMECEHFDGYAYQFGCPFTVSQGNKIGEMDEMKLHFNKSLQRVGEIRRKEALFDAGSNLLRRAKPSDLSLLSENPKNFGLTIQQKSNEYDNGGIHEKYGL